MCLAFRGIADREVIARKPHRCGWCGYKMAKGDRARYRVYVLDRELTTDWMHPDCYDAMNKSAREAICDGWMPGDFERGEIAA